MLESIIAAGRGRVIRDEWPAESTAEEREAGFRDVSEAIRNSDVPVVWITKVSGDATRFDAVVRKGLSQRLAAVEAGCGASVVGRAYVAADAELRGVVTAVLWGVETEWRTETFASMDGAIRWAQTTLAVESVPRPAPT